MFGDKVEQVNSSNHYSARPMTAADAEPEPETMRLFYNARFANAADFTYFLCRAFTVDDHAAAREVDRLLAVDGKKTPSRATWV